MTTPRTAGPSGSACAIRQLSSTDRSDVTDSIVRFCARDIRPFNIVEGKRIFSNLFILIKLINLLTDLTSFELGVGLQGTDLTKYTCLLIDFIIFYFFYFLFYGFVCSFILFKLRTLCI